MMKRKRKINIIFLFSVALFLVYAGFTSCKKIPDPSGGKIEKDTINYDLLKTSIFIQFLDANTNEYLIPEVGEELKVQVVGKSKDAVADIVGFQKSEYNIRKGIITFGLVPNAEFVPTSISPVRFTIIAQLHGYLTSAQEVTITSEGDYILKVFMVNKDNPPPGVVIKRSYNVGNLVNGVLQDTVSIATTNLEGKVVLPAGIRLLRSDSVELAGKLNLTLSYYNGQDDRALAAFPGGITGTVLENSSTNSGVFFPAGLLSLEITDSDWHKASIIENDSLEITMVVPEQVYNPVSSSQVISGDLVPLYSYMCDTGLWMFDGWAQITDTLFSRLSVTARTSRLQNFNFSWFEENNCNQGSNFEISGNCQQCNSIMLDGVVRKQADNSFISGITLAANWNGSITIPFSTGGTPVYIEWDVSSECNYCYVDPSVSPLLIDDMCSQQSIPLPLNDDGPVSKTILANFVGSCVSDTNYIILPSFGLWIRPADASCRRWASMKNGVAQICNVVYGQTYVLGTYYNGIWQEWVITITEENNYTFEIEFSQSVCSGVFGIL